MYTAQGVAPTLQVKYPKYRDNKLNKANIYNYN